MGLHGCLVAGGEEDGWKWVDYTHKGLLRVMRGLVGVWETREWENKA